VRIFGLRFFTPTTGYYASRNPAIVHAGIAIGDSATFNYPSTNILEKEENYYIITHALSNLVNCLLSAQDYLNILEERGELPLL
jgi:hypothetical protein